MPDPLLGRLAGLECEQALRVGVGLLLPGLCLVGIGRPELIIYAVFGSFAGMYARSASRSVRLVQQSQGALLLLAGTAVGILLSQAGARPAVVVASATVFAVAGSMLADFFALRPEGPFYGVFALGAVAGVPASLVAPLEAWGIAAGSAAFALLIGLTGPDVMPTSARAIAAAVRRERARARPAAMLHAVRYAVAISFAGTIAILLGLGHANWAIAGAAVTLAAADPRGRLWRGVHRLLGTVAGLALTAVILAPELSARTSAFLVILLLFPTEMFMAVNYAVALSFFTPMIMLMTELAAPIGVSELLSTRAAGTLVGVLTGFAVTYLIRDRAAVEV